MQYRYNFVFIKTIFGSGNLESLLLNNNNLSFNHAGEQNYCECYFPEFDNIHCNTYLLNDQCKNVQLAFFKNKKDNWTCCILRTIFVFLYFFGNHVNAFYCHFSVCRIRFC